jgi:hypothetical protein
VPFRAVGKPRKCCKTIPETLVREQGLCRTARTLCLNYYPLKKRLSAGRGHWELRDPFLAKAYTASY